MNKKEKERYLRKFIFPFCHDASKYEKVAKIGQGTYGEVFKVRDGTNPKKFVAMKKILMSDNRGGFPINTLKEIKLLQQLKNKNIVNYIEVCKAKATQRDQLLPTFYLVMDFCEHDLAGLLSNMNVQFSLGEKKNIMKQLFNGLHFIHTNNILHRDIKSANILITKSGVLKLSDFGLAKSFIRSNNDLKKCYSSEKVVTLWYRPPELLLGAKNYGPPVDLWGAGCIMAEMWNRFPIMPGSTEQHQLNLISQLCGSITPDAWPGVEKLELYKKMMLVRGQKRKLEARMKFYIRDSCARDLLDKLLIPDPSQRISSHAALDHNFFWTEPLPCDLRNILAQHTQSMFQYYAVPRRRGHVWGQAHSSSTSADTDYEDRVF
ncbi:cyclin-dependent kinase 9-like [Copidosoma floridanum]|uniref:cyclin-dependent kinase 9-like n=1 Tax=Copidosoma floridanum TaxID=29053 RepID=UPI0006C97ABD|nr:cyclin-dependent kinase 9-like [Copidosoma floridanum]